MILLLGVLLGLGLVLGLSPFLWPRGKTSAADAVSARSRDGGRGIPGGRGIRGVRTLEDTLAQTGLRAMKPSTVIIVSIIVGVMAGGLVFAFVPVIAVAIVAGGVGMFAPITLLRGRARRLQDAQRASWPDVVDHLVSAVRSGLSLPDAVSSLSLTGPPGARAAFAGFERTYQLTGDFSVAIDELKATLADPVADRILETLRMAREVGGGELSGILHDLNAFLRQETALRSEVVARQSWVMNAARLGVAAPWIVLLFLASRPEAARAYNSPPGFLLIVGGLLACAVAYRSMKRIGRLPEEPRWFR